MYELFPKSIVLKIRAFHVQGSFIFTEDNRVVYGKEND
jgi:hypothetical protein